MYGELVSASTCSSLIGVTTESLQRCHIRAPPPPPAPAPPLAPAPSPNPTPTDGDAAEDNKGLEEEDNEGISAEVLPLPTRGGGMADKEDNGGLTEEEDNEGLAATGTSHT